MMNGAIYRTAVAALLALSCSSWAHADLTGLVVFREGVRGTGPAPSGPERWIYRVYAEFSDATDSVFSWGGGGSTSVASIYNVTPSGVPGSGFTNIGNVGGDKAPFVPGTVRDWDTYMTIGILYGYEGLKGLDATVVSSATPTFISNGATSWVTGVAGGGVTLGSISPQGRGDYRVGGNDTANRVLLMQLVVNAGEHVTGSVRVSWRVQGGDLQFTPHLEFSSIPAPSTLLILLAGSWCRKRRRV